MKHVPSQEKPNFYQLVAGCVSRKVFEQRDNKQNKKGALATDMQFVCADCSYERGKEVKHPWTEFKITSQWSLQDVLATGAWKRCQACWRKQGKGLHGPKGSGKGKKAFHCGIMGALSGKAGKSAGKQGSHIGAKLGVMGGRPPRKH